jgi:hypothetical protein
MSSRCRKPRPVGPRRLAVICGGAFDRSGGEVADDLEEGLVGAEVLLAGVGGQFQRDDRDREAHRLGQPAGVVLDQFGRAGGADDDRFRLEAVVGVLAGAP